MEIKEIKDALQPMVDGVNNQIKAELKSLDEKTEELRLGNWVRHTNCICKEEMQLDFDLIKNEIRLSDNTYPELEPILITSEVLEDAGFDYDSGFQDGSKIFYILLTTIHLETLNGNLTNDTIQIGFNKVELKYLHQLQNLYFALTGKELEIKL